MLRLKNWIEKSVGVSMGDALNVLLFGLSVIAIIVSLISLYVAIATKKDADASGADQQKTLNDTRKSIADLLVTLKISNQILQASTTVAEKQTEQLATQVKTSREQLSILGAEWQAQRSKPDIGAVLTNSSAPSITLYNLSKAKPVTKGSYELIMVDVEKPFGFSYQLVETASTEVNWIRPGGSYLPSLLPLIKIPDEPIKKGDRLFGYLVVDCADCSVHHVYGVYIEYMKLGFFRELTSDEFPLANFKPEGMEQRIETFLKLSGLKSLD